MPPSPSPGITGPSLRSWNMTCYELGLSGAAAAEMGSIQTEIGRSFPFWNALTFQTAAEGVGADCCFAACNT